MMKHEDNPQAPSFSAAKVRVTPEELAAAVTALQIRKEGQPGTIAIGNAVEELGLDVTPEEVLAEVQARRQIAKPKRRRDYWALACAGACFLLPFVVGGISQAMQYSTPSISFDAAAIPEARQLQLDPDHLQVGESNSRNLILMSEAGDNQPVHALLYNSQDWGDYNPYYTPTSWESWTLIKHDGKLYLRGWIAPVSEKLIQQDGIEIANRRSSENSIPITLPLTGFSVKPEANKGETTEFIAEDVHLDKHAYEKW